MKKEMEREAIIGHLVALLKKYRETQGLSLNETAWRSGLSHTMILRVERRDRLPTIDTLLRITDALGADLAVLLVQAIQSVRGEPNKKAEQRLRKNSPRNRDGLKQQDR